MNKKTVFLFIFTVMTIATFLFMPVLALMFTIIIFVILNSRFSLFVIILSLSLLLGLLASSIDPYFSNIGDVVVYYNEFANENLIDTIFSFKVYRYILFQFQYFFNIPVKFYTFLSIFLLYFTFNIYSKIILESLSLNMNLLKFKLLFIFSNIAAIPFFVFSSFENTLSFAFLFLSFSLFLKQRYYISVFFIISAVLTHLSSLLFLFMFFVTKLTKNLGRWFLVLVFSAFILFIFFLAKLEVFTGLSLLDAILSRYYKYINGPWSSYIGMLEKMILVLGFIKIFIMYYVFRCIDSGVISTRFFNKKNNVFIANLLLVYILFSFYFITARTFNLRYIYIGSSLLMPFIIYLIYTNSVKNLKPFLLFSYILVMFFSPSNVYYLYGLSLSNAKISPNYLIFSSWREIIGSEANLPRGKYIYESRTEKVQATKEE